MLNDEIDDVRIGALHGIAYFNDVSELKVSYQSSLRGFNYYSLLYYRNTRLT